MRRFFEILPAALAWLTLILMVLFSYKLPTAVSIFIILFDIYWLLKTAYLSLHLRFTFGEMRANLKVNWLEKLKNAQFENCLPAEALALPKLSAERRLAQAGKLEIGNWRDVYHLVILPMYREPYEVVRESFLSLLRENYPQDKLIVVLAVEERAGAEARLVAQKIGKEFGDRFFKFLITVHPQNIPGEIPGKGSNETWAAKRAKEELIDPLRLDYDRIIVSVFDIDTQVPGEYFSRLVYVFLSSENRLRAIYQPIPLYVNNIYQASVFSRVISFSNTFWHMMQQARPERLRSYSSQSLPFRVLIDVGFWDKDVVSEDSHIFFQGLLRYHGDFRTVPLNYPVSMDANVAPTFRQTLKNIYRQMRRWGWGVENLPYMLEGFRKDAEIPARVKWRWSLIELEGFHSWATNSLIIFALGWLPVLLGGKNFNYTLLSYGLPQITRFIITLSMVGIASSAVLGILLLPPRPQWFRPWHYLVYFFQWLLIPLTLIIFGALPGLESQTRLALGGKWRLGFWVTPKSRN